MATKSEKLVGLVHKQRAERGFTLLEYCAGAAVILVVIWGALNTLGTNMSGLLGSMGDWATHRSNEIKANQ